MDTRIAIHALSRSVDITLCDACGIVIRITIRISILRSRYNTRIAGPSIAMHRCIVTTLTRSAMGGVLCEGYYYVMTHLCRVVLE